MNLENSWVQFGIHVFVGTMAGGLSDTVAVWMLFNPKQKKFGFQGAIPKNQARLAKSLGRTVGERLLTPGDLQKELARPELLAAFQSRIEDVIAPSNAPTTAGGTLSIKGSRDVRIVVMTSSIRD